MVAFSSELATDFGFVTDCEQVPNGEEVAPEVAERLRQRASEVDLVVTTSFHATLLNRVLGDSKTVLVMSVNPALRDQIKQRLEEPVTIVIVDPLFAERIRTYAPQLPGSGDKVKIVLAAQADPGALPEESTVYTRAARRALGLGEYHLLSGNVPFIGPESAAALCDFIVERVLVDQSASPEVISAELPRAITSARTSNAS